MFDYSKVHVGLTRTAETETLKQSFLQTLLQLTW